MPGIANDLAIFTNHKDEAKYLIEKLLEIAQKTDHQTSSEES